MNNKALFALSFLVMLIVLAGCTQTQETTTGTEGTPTAPSEAETSPQGAGTPTPSGNKIEFKVALTMGGQTQTQHFMARNLDSPTPDFRMIAIDGNSESIVLGSQQKGWMKYPTAGEEWEWTEISTMYPEWNEAWEDHYTELFQPFYELALQAQGSEYSQGGAGEGIRIYDIDKNPTFPPDTFSNPT